MRELNLVALGDCNTLGVNDCRSNSFPERVGRTLGARTRNLGYTMATTREARRLYTQQIADQTDILLISIGLTDSWESLRFTPYVLYYPDNPLRRLGRKTVKAFKKRARSFGLNRIIGVAPVTSPQRYVDNLTAIIKRTPAHAMVLLIDALPKLEDERNVSIERFNRLLDTFPERFGNVRRVRCFSTFHAERTLLFQDRTHLNDRGCETLARMIVDEVQAGWPEVKAIRAAA